MRHLRKAARVVAYWLYLRGFIGSERLQAAQGWIERWGR